MDGIIGPGGASADQLQESYAFLMNANPSTRARLRELLDGYDKMLDSRISALSALSVKESSLRRNVQFEKREARHEFMSKLGVGGGEGGGGSPIGFGGDNPSPIGHPSATAAAAVPPAALDDNTQSAFDKAKNDVKKMFRLVKQHDARKLENEQRRERKKKYGQLLNLDIGNADEEGGSVTSGASGGGMGEYGSNALQEFGLEASQTTSYGSFAITEGGDLDTFFDRHASTLSSYNFGGTSSSGDGGDGAGGGADADDMRGVRFSDPKVLRKRLDLEIDKNKTLREKLSDHLLSSERCAKEFIKEQEATQRVVAAKHFPSVCDCTACIACIAEVAEVVGREVDETLEALFPLQLRHNLPDHHHHQQLYSSETTTHSPSSPSVLREQMSKSLLKERRRAVQLRIRSAQLQREGESLDEQYQSLGGDADSTNNGGKHHHHSSPTRRSRHQHLGVDDDDVAADTTTSYLDEDSFNDVLGNTSALSASALPSIVQCVEKYRSGLLQLVNERAVHERSVRNSNLLEAVGVLTGRLVAPLEVIAAVSEAEHQEK